MKYYEVTCIIAVDNIQRLFEMAEDVIQTKRRETLPAVISPMTQTKPVEKSESRMTARTILLQEMEKGGILNLKTARELLQKHDYKPSGAATVLSNLIKEKKIKRTAEGVQLKQH